MQSSAVKRWNCFSYFRLFPLLHAHVTIVTIGRDMSGWPGAGGVSEDKWPLATEPRATMNSTVKCQSKSKHKVPDVKRSNDCNDNHDSKCGELILMKPLEGANSRSYEPAASTKSRQSYQLSDKLFGNYFDSGTWEYLILLLKFGKTTFPCHWCNKVPKSSWSR